MLIAAREVLLISDILVASQQEVKPGLLGGVEQVTVLQALPPSSSARVTSCPPKKWLSGAGVFASKRTFTRRPRGLQGILREREHNMDLLPGDRREGLEKFVNGRALIDVIEQSRHWKARAEEAPDPAQFAGIAIHGAAAAPIHAFTLSPFP